LVSGRKQKHSFPRASRAAARANTQPAAPPRGRRRPAPKRPDEHHRELTQDEARGSLGLAVPAPHICLLLQGDIWDDSNCRTTGKGILSGFYFLQCQGEPLLTVSFDAILAFLRREGEKGALAPGKVGSRVPAAPDDPSHDHHKVWPRSHHICPWKLSLRDQERRIKVRAPSTFPQDPSGASYAGGRQLKAKSTNGVNCWGSLEGKGRHGQTIQAPFTR